jgi:hypothetical protein
LLVIPMAEKRGSPETFSDINPPHENPSAAIFVVSSLW